MVLFLSAVFSKVDLWCKTINPFFEIRPLWPYFKIIKSYLRFFYFLGKFQTMLVSVLAFYNNFLAPRKTSKTIPFLFALIIFVFIPFFRALQNTIVITWKTLCNSVLKLDGTNLFYFILPAMIFIISMATL